MLTNEYIINGERLQRFYELEFEVDGIQYVNPMRVYTSGRSTNANNARPMFEVLEDHVCSDDDYPDYCDW